MTSNRRTPQPDSSVPTGDGHDPRKAIVRLLDRPLTGDDIREATARVRRPVASVTREATGLLVFLLADEPLALRAGGIRRVARLASVHRVPHRSNAVFRGLCSMDGQLVLCANLRALLDLPAGRNAVVAGDEDSRRMIVLSDRSGGWAFEVDAVQEVVHVDLTAARRPPMTVEQARDRYAEMLVPRGAVHVTLLDTNRLRAGFEAALS